jgi:cytoskeletal protein CcmA (bactofilin family)
MTLPRSRERTAATACPTVRDVLARSSISIGVSMFTRSPPAPSANSSRERGQPLQVSPDGGAAAFAALSTNASLLGKDIKITGMDIRISSGGTLRIDGEVEGEVHGDAVIIGETARITGMVSGREVVVRGHVCGMIRAGRVVLQASSRIEGDIQHEALVIEPGAQFDGRCQRLHESLNGNLA